jgi:hypothetical protein
LKSPTATAHTKTKPRAFHAQALEELAPVLACDLQMTQPGSLQPGCNSASSALCYASGPEPNQFKGQWDPLGAHFEAQLHCKQNQNKAHSINKLNHYLLQNQRVFPKKTVVQTNFYLKMRNSRQTKHRIHHHARSTAERILTQ